MLKLNSEHQYRMEKIQADRDIAQVGLAKGQLEINKEEAKSGSIFIAGWRPAIAMLSIVLLFWFGEFLRSEVCNYLLDH